MTTLFGTAPKDTFPALLKLNRPASIVPGKEDPGIGAELRVVEDGLGNATPLQLSLTRISLNDTLWPIDSVANNQLLGSDAQGNLVWLTFHALIPDFTNHPGKVLTNDGTTVSWKTPTSGSTPLEPDSVVYEYNEYNDIMKIVEVYQGETKTTTMNYNPDRTVESVVSTFGGSTRTESYTYNVSGKVKTMTAINS